MKLIELPNAAFAQSLFTVGKEYKILSAVGNCFVVENDDGDATYVLMTRFA